MATDGGPNIVTNGLVLHLDAGNVKSYPGSGTTWFDKSGNGNNGTLINGAIYSSTNGGSIVFDGVNDLLEGNDNGLLDFGTNSFSISTWMKFNTLQSGYKSIFSRGNPANGTRRWFYLAKYETNNKFLFAVDDDIIKREVVSNTSAVVNVWYNVVGVRESNISNRIYVNGIFESSQSDDGNSLDVDPIDALFRFAAHRQTGTYEHCNCTISNGSIYNKALSPQEVLQNYNATKSRFNL